MQHLWFASSCVHTCMVTVDVVSCCIVLLLFDGICFHTVMLHVGAESRMHMQTFAQPSVRIAWTKKAI